MPTTAGNAHQGASFLRAALLRPSLSRIDRPNLALDRHLDGERKVRTSFPMAFGHVDDVLTRGLIVAVADLWAVSPRLDVGVEREAKCPTADLVFNGGKFGMWVGNQQ